MDSNNFHVPVLLSEVIDNLLTSNPLVTNSAASVSVFDGTLGGGGYSQGVLDWFLSNHKNINLHSSDLDQSAIDRVLGYIKVDDSQNLELRQGNFADVINEFEDETFGAIMLDLGFSSNQLEESERGFAYLKREQLLDLRYDVNSGESASYKLLHLHNWKQLGKIIYENSGEDLAMRIAKKLSDANKKTPWQVGEFVDLVITVIPITALKRKNQILSRVWQALRIWVNNEFGSLNSFLPAALDKLAIGGRLGIVSFHSLEDKIITKFMRDNCKPTSEDVYGNKTYNYKFLTPRPIAPSEDEVTRNIRSRSGLLRVIERLE